MSTAFAITWLLRLPYPARNLLRRWRGMLGMMVGVGIALGIGMAMLAINNATIELFTADFRRSAANLYGVTEGGTPIPILPGESPGRIEHAHRTLAQLRTLPAVNEAVGVMSWTVERERPGPKQPDAPDGQVLATGVDGDPTRIPGALDLKEGRWLQRSDKVVLGRKLAREKGLAVGDTLRLAERDFMVVGVGTLRGFGFAMDSVAYLDARAFARRAAVGDVVNLIAIEAADPEQARTRISEIGSLAAFSPEQLVAQAEAANADAVTIRWVFSGLTLVIAALFVSNMLARSVARRRLEFATLRAIGIPNRTLLLTVAAEAAIVSLVAVAVGIGLSSVVGWAINRYLAPRYQLDTLYSAGAGLFALVFLLALGLGLVAGLLPACEA